MEMSRPAQRPVRFLCALLVAGSSGAILSAQQGPMPQPAPPPAPKAPPYLNSPLKTVPELQIRITCVIKQPTAPQIVALLQEKTGLRITLDPKVDPLKPALGSLSGSNVPAWILMEQLAHSEIVQGTWQREGDGYRLVSQVPEPTPAEKMAQTQVEERSPITWDGRIYLLAGLLFSALFAGIALLRRRMRGSHTEPHPSQPLNSSVQKGTNS